MRHLSDPRAGLRPARHRTCRSDGPHQAKNSPQWTVLRPGSAHPRGSRKLGAARRFLERRGLTLIELMVGLSISALLALTAAPYYADYITNSRLREGGNLVLAEALAAQSEAIKRNRTVRLATAGSTVQVLDMTDPANPVQLRQREMSGGVSAASATLDFGSEGRLLPFPSSAAVDLSKTGVSCSGELRCPGLRIDVGGAIKLCGNQLDSGC
ncbi:MAG TPA: GspH/FimT family pseudopilin [Rubrivivax sp.]|nr:GspH/FimT family pseudopilin [Rubrivivax sp.]